MSEHLHLILLDLFSRVAPGASFLLCDPNYNAVLYSLGNLLRKMSTLYKNLYSFLVFTNLLSPHLLVSPQNFPNL